MPRVEAPLPAHALEGLTLLLSAATAAELERAARRRDRTPAELIARLVGDSLRQEAGHRPHAQG